MNHIPTWAEIMAIIEESRKHPERMIPLDLDDLTPDQEAEG
jgi:hypothetical protein